MSTYHFVFAWFIGDDGCGRWRDCLRNNNKSIEKKRRDRKRD